MAALYPERQSPGERKKAPLRYVTNVPGGGRSLTVIGSGKPLLIFAGRAHEFIVPFFVTTGQDMPGFHAASFRQT